jgi:hypothetical protein
MMEGPNRVLIATDLEASGIWLISTRSEETRKTWLDLLGEQLTTDLKAWNDSADELFGGRVRSNDCDQNAETAFYANAQQLGVRVQEKLGDSWEVLWNDGGQNRCWSWIQRPTSSE